MSKTLIVTHGERAGLSPFRPDQNKRIAEKIALGDFDFVVFYDHLRSGAPAFPVDEYAAEGINGKQIFGGNRVPLSAVADWGENSPDFTFEICGTGGDTILLGVLATIRNVFPLAKVRIDMAAVDCDICLMSVGTTEDGRFDLADTAFDALAAIYLLNGAEVYSLEEAADEGD